MWGARHSEVTASRVHKNLQLFFFKEKKKWEVSSYLKKRQGQQFIDWRKPISPLI